MTGDQGSGWHDDPYEHDLARQGVKTKRPGITESDAEKIVTAIKGKSTSHDSQVKTQMTWYDELWLDGKKIPDERLDELDLEDLQAIRKSAEDHIQKISKDAEVFKPFYQREVSRLKSATSDKLKNKQKELEKQMGEIRE